MHDYQPTTDLAHAVVALRDELEPRARPFVAALLHACGPECDDGQPTPAARWAAGAFDVHLVDEIHEAVVAMVLLTDCPSPVAVVEHTRQRARLTVAGLEVEARAAIATFLTLRRLLAAPTTVH